MSFSDIRQDSWIDYALPEAMRPYARLLRLDRPIGTWLLLIPCWWGVTLAGGKWPNLWFMILFGIGAIIMRGAGCIINDIYDRDLDAQVERTRMRPLASGEISLQQALILLAVLLLIGFGILLLFNGLTVIIGIASLALVFIYPYMKRITWWPQLFLGLTFNWGALLGWTAVRDNLDWPAVCLYAAGIFWTLGYDTIYAHQDKRDDMAAGIKSTALLFDEQSKLWVSGFYILTIGLLITSGWLAGLGPIYVLGLSAASAFAAKELYLWKINDPENCLRRFRNNRDFGLLVLAGIILDQLI